MREINVNIPFQVELIIKSMLSPAENVYLRGNYRARLDVIQNEINKAIKKYDQEIQLFDMRNKK